MSTLPNVPPILDADRVIFLTVTSPTSVIPVTFPVFGAQEDLQVIVNFAILPTNQWTFTSASGSPLTVLPLPITDGQVTLLTPVSAGTIEIVGNWQPRQVIQPSAPGIARREFNQTVSSVIASLREVSRALRITPTFIQIDALGNGYYDAQSHLISNVADAQSNLDAVNLETLNNGLSNLVSSGGILSLQSWTLTGDGVTLVFSLAAGAALSGNSLAYVVTVNGLTIAPNAYTIATGARTITFTSPPPAASAIVVRILGVARSITNLASTAQALAGTDDATFMSPLKTAQAVAADLVAFLASTPTFTSAARGLTAPSGDNTTKLATTQFVQAASQFGPTGRLTLSSGVPVMSAAVLAAASVYYAPYTGAVIPIWNSARFCNFAFSELTCLLSDATKSPAAAVAGAVYDLFVWNDAGTLRLSRGPAWTSATARSAGTAVVRISGILVNSVAITNGPGASLGTYVGTIATDTGAATLTFNPSPAAASGGPAGGAWVGLWNQYNRAALAASAQDGKTGAPGWSYGAAVWRAADASTDNRITFVCGSAEDAITANYSTQAFQLATGIGFNSTSALTGIPGDANGTTGIFTMGAIAIVAPTIGRNFFQALEYANTAGGNAYGGSNSLGVAMQVMQLSAQLRY